MPRWVRQASPVEYDQQVNIDSVLDELRERLPEVHIERLKVTWPADDDNLWYIRSGAGPEVQIECRSEGRGPFLIEGDGRGQRMETADAREAVNTIVEWLAAD
jgi:hypothetical protein